MAVESKRGCGYRKVGGLYLVSEPGGVPCDRLPLELTVCPVCSHGFKQARGFTWVDVAGLVGGVHRDCLDEFPCPLCMSTEQMGRAPAAFEMESRALGVSRRVHALPRGFKVGETWVLLAHPKTLPCSECVATGLVGGVPCEKCKAKGWLAGVFKVWRPSRVEKLLNESQRGSEEAEDLVKRGITPIFVPDDDPDHQGSVYDAEEEPAALSTT